MKFSVCADALYMNGDFFQGIKEIHDYGIKNIEFWTWWDKDIQKLRTVQEELGMNITAFCTKFVSLTNPEMRDKYKQGLKETIEAAKQLHCKCIISQVGDDTKAARDVQRSSIVQGLKECVPMLEEEGITLVIEPLNIRVDHEGYYLSESEEAFGIIDEIGSEHVKVLFDIYHQQITEGDILRRVEKNIHKIGHFHAAGNPGRHELEHSELSYEYILKAIESFGYNHYIGLEYFPVASAKEGLEKIAKLEKEI